MLMTEVIRAAIPGASDDLCEFVLWSRTPFPVGGTTAKGLYRAADRLRRAGENGRQLCDMCDRAIATGFTCDHCRKLLEVPDETR